MPGTQVEDPSVFGLAACDEGGPGFVNVSGADGHQCTTSWNPDAKKIHTHASACSCDAKREAGTIRNMRT